MILTNSERAQFRRCRRAWDYQSLHRQGYTRKGLPAKALTLGTVFHLALSAQADGKDPVQTILTWEHEQQQDIVKRYGGSYKEEARLADLQEILVLVKGMLNHYFDHYTWENPISPLQYVGSEISFRVPIPNTIDGDDAWYGGTFDGLAVEPNIPGYVLVENKTFSSSPDITTLEMHDQITSYVWAAWQLFGEPPRYVLYNGVRKKLPTVPKLLQNGKLSQQWIETTAEAYREAIHTYGLDSSEYIDILKRLESRDKLEQNPFFSRFHLLFVPEAIESFEKRLILEYNDIANTSIGIYPNFQFQGCYDCGIRDLCKATELQEDVDFILQEDFTVSSGYQTIWAQLATPQKVSNILDLSKKVKAGDLWQEDVEQNADR